MKLRDANLQVYEKNSFTHILHGFCLQNIMITSSEEALKCASKIYFRKYKQKVMLLVTYLSYYDSSKSTLFMLNMAFDVVLSTAFVK